MIKYGIKLWSINRRRFFEQAVKLYKQGEIDFVELYIHPAMTELKELKMFKNVRLTLHATHYEHGFDLAALNAENINLYKKIIAIADYLTAEKIVVHAGVDINSSNFKANFKRIYDLRLLIENLPKISLDDKEFFGYSFKRLKWIKRNVFPNFCFDFDHAVKAAFSQRLDYKIFITDLIKELKPSYFHLCDGLSNCEKDEHLNLGEGNFDLKWIKKLLLKISRKKVIDLVFEVPKNENDLDNDLANIEYFKRLSI